ncbi:hypothetical protein ACFWN7_12780 [Agromyces sp. NPDC058484]|uniref:hypothetical protein n=1 Tax=Agromyces sp. NPDC058484 TaxID=3346524 RepID=UPI003659072F
MQLSADFVALGMHHADVQRAEREIGLRMRAEERGSGDAGASPEPASHRRHRVHRRAPRLALR